jgi:hypothetical protein
MQAKIATASDQSTPPTWIVSWARARLPTVLELYSSLRRAPFGECVQEPSVLFDVHADADGRQQFLEGKGSFCYMKV